MITNVPICFVFLFIKLHLQTAFLLFYHDFKHVETDIFTMIQTGGNCVLFTQFPPASFHYFIILLPSLPYSHALGFDLLADIQHHHIGLGNHIGTFFQLLADVQIVA